MAPERAGKGLWTRMSADGKHAAAGMSLGAVGTKPGAGGETQPYDDHGRYLGGKEPATVTWKNDDRSKPDPRAEELAPELRDQVRRMGVEVPKLDSFNVNSGRRPFDPARPREPHAAGRAVDINNINGQRVVNLKTATEPGADHAREAAANLEKWAEKNESIHQFIGPNGGWTRMGKDTLVPITNKNTLDAHTNHYHIGI